VGELPVALFEEPAPGKPVAQETPAAHIEERQDATLEDIGRFMMALDPLVAAGQQADGFAAEQATAEATPAVAQESAPAAEVSGEPPPADSDYFLFGPEPQIEPATPEPPEPLEETKAATSNEEEPADFLLGPAPELPLPSTPIPPAPAANAAKNPFETILAHALDALSNRPQPATHAAEPIPPAQKADIPMAASEPTLPPQQNYRSPAGLPNDPLASLRALSDAEKIALFS
jgi:hypothetical protein